MTKHVRHTAGDLINLFSWSETRRRLNRSGTLLKNGLPGFAEFLVAPYLATFVIAYVVGRQCLLQVVRPVLHNDPIRIGTCLIGAILSGPLLLIIFQFTRKCLLLRLLLIALLGMTLAGLVSVSCR